MEQLTETDTPMSATAMLSAAAEEEISQLEQPDAEDVQDTAIDYSNMDLEELTEEVSKYEDKKKLPSNLIMSVYCLMYEVADNMFVLQFNDQIGSIFYRKNRFQLTEIINEPEDAVLYRFCENNQLMAAIHSIGITVEKFLVSWKKDTDKRIDIETYTIGDQNVCTLHIGTEPDKNTSTIVDQMNLSEFDYDEWKEIMPHWSDILERMSDPNAFLTYIWGAYSQEYKGRRALWLYSESAINAEEGKSTLASVIGLELFGNILSIDGKNKIPNGAFTVFNRKTSKSGDTFALAPHLKSKFMVYPDCQDTMFPLSNDFRILNSGGRDPVSINIKYKTPINSVIDAKLFIHSNYAPHIRGERAVMSRMLPITIAPWNAERMGYMKSYILAEHLTAQLPHFLALAKQLWAIHQDVVISSRTEQLLNDLVDDSNEDYLDVFEGCFEATGNNLDKIRAQDIYETFDIGNDAYAKSNLCSFLLSVGVEKVRETKRGDRGYYFSNIQYKCNVDKNTYRRKQNKSESTRQQYLKLKMANDSPPMNDSIEIDFMEDE